MKNIFYQKNYQRIFGTYPLQEDVLLQAVSDALDVGYRAIDTAQMYGNEQYVGEALDNSSLKREELCVVTKVHPDNFSAEKFIASVEESLKKLRMSYVDVLLLHWPPIGGDIVPSLKLLEQAYDKGLAKNIGVSNYNGAMMRQAVKIIDTPIIVNQVEFHPMLNQDKLLSFANDVGIPLSSYSSVARGKVLESDVLQHIGDDYGKTAIQICLRWILQKGVAINTMSTKKDNMQKNYDIMDFTLSHCDMAKIDALTAQNYRIVDESLVPWAPAWD